MDIQVVLSQWMSQIAEYLPLGYAFGAGMVSAVNPCGFFMLPVYMSLYLGAEQTEFLQHSLPYRILKAAWVALVVTSGFALLFGLVGAVVSAGGYFLMGIMPWFAIVVGSLLILLGGWILMGHNLSFPLILKLAAKIGDPKEMTNWGFFLFGVAFGATSLGCTLPIFLAVVGSSATSGSFISGFVQFISYILGMGVVLMALTLGIALVKKRLVVGTMRRIMPYGQKISAIFLLIAGGYILHYWFSSGLLLTS